MPKFSRSCWKNSDVLPIGSSKCNFPGSFARSLEEPGIMHIKMYTMNVRIFSLNSGKPYTNWSLLAYEPFCLTAVNNLECSTVLKWQHTVWARILEYSFYGCRWGSGPSFRTRDIWKQVPVLLFRSITTPGMLDRMTERRKRRPESIGVTQRRTCATFV